MATSTLAPPASTLSVVAPDSPRTEPSHTPGLSKKLEKCGARFGLQFDMYRSVQAIIDAGRARDPTAPPGTYGSWDVKLHKLFDRLIAIAPEVLDELAVRGPMGSPELAEMIERGRTRDRNNNINSCKAAIRDWIKFDPPLPLEKQFRGFNSVTSGRLLCPALYDYDNPIVRDALLEGRSDYPAKAEDYPAYLWRDGAVDRTDIFKGFGEGILIYKALQHILVAPSLAKAGNAPASRSTRKGRAKIHNIISMTPAMIAYAACMVHFALSSQVVFSAGAEDEPGKFWYEGFYNRIIKTIEEDMTDVQRDTLLLFHMGKVLSAAQEAPRSACRRAHPSIAEYMAAQAAGIQGV